MGFWRPSPSPSRARATRHWRPCAMTPNWWVGSGTFKISWFAGQSQTKRFFVISKPDTSAANGTAALPDSSNTLKRGKGGQGQL